MISGGEKPAKAGGKNRKGKGDGRADGPKPTSMLGASHRTMVSNSLLFHELGSERTSERSEQSDESERAYG